LSAAEVTRLNAQGERVTNRTAFYDLGMANMSLATEATRRGLNLRMMGGFDLEGARKLLPPHMDVACILALGYANDGAHLPPDVRERDHAPRARKSAAELMLN
jgi:nitroreductase